MDSSARESSEEMVASLPPIKEAPLEHILSIDLGQIQNPEKPFTMLSAASFGYSITNTSTGVLFLVGNAMFGGGPLFFYSTLVVNFVGVSVAIGPGELASAYPHAGGQYFWVAQLAPAWQSTILVIHDGHRLLGLCGLRGCVCLFCFDQCTLLDGSHHAPWLRVSLVAGVFGFRGMESHCFDLQYL